MQRIFDDLPGPTNKFVVHPDGRLRILWMVLIDGNRIPDEFRVDGREQLLNITNQHSGGQPQVMSERKKFISKKDALAFSITAWNDPGNWTSGIYRFEFLDERGQVVVAQEFEVINTGDLQGEYLGFCVTSTSQMYGDLLRMGCLGCTAEEYQQVKAAVNRAAGSLCQCMWDGLKPPNLDAEEVRALIAYFSSGPFGDSPHGSNDPDYGREEFMADFALVSMYTSRLMRCATESLLP